MTYMFTRPDCWDPLPGRVIHWDPAKSAEECLKDAGYVLVKGDEGVRGLGTWSLYARVQGDIRLPKYYVMMDDGSGTEAEIWIQSLPDLLVWIRLYGHLGEERK